MHACGAIQSTLEEETVTDLFGEQVVLCGGLGALMKAAFETLVDAGYQAEVAYLVCVQELKQIVDLVYQHGPSGMRQMISTTAEYGDYTRGPRIVTAETKAEMGRILEEIRDGRFAREWLAEAQSGGPAFQALRSQRNKRIRSNRRAATCDGSCPGSRDATEPPASRRRASRSADTSPKAQARVSRFPSLACASG